MSNWLSRDFADLSFNTTFKRYGQIQQYLEEEQVEDLEKIRKIVGFATINVNGLDNLIIIKDMAIASMPHNLILDIDGEFLSRKKSLTCVPSAEWLIKQRKNSDKLTENFSIEMWIPTEAGDYTLNNLSHSVQIYISLVLFSNYIYPLN